MNAPAESARDAGLAGKVGIVTGGGAADDGIGNGRAAAIVLARSGTRVLAVERRAELADRTVEIVNSEGGTAAAFTSDVTEDAQCQAMIAAAVERFARLDFLDNHVGIGSRGSVVDEDPVVWDRLMSVNVRSVFLAAKYAIPAMIETAGGGAIVYVASIAALGRKA